MVKKPALQNTTDMAESHHEKAEECNQAVHDNALRCSDSYQNTVSQQIVLSVFQLCFAKWFFNPQTHKKILKMTSRNLLNAWQQRYR